MPDKIKITANQRFELEAYYAWLCSTDGFEEESTKEAMRSTINRCSYEDEYKAIIGYLRAKVETDFIQQIQNFIQKYL